MGSVAFQMLTFVHSELHKCGSTDNDLLCPYQTIARPEQILVVSFTWDVLVCIVWRAEDSSIVHGRSKAMADLSNGIKAQWYVVVGCRPRFWCSSKASLLSHDCLSDLLERHSAPRLESRLAIVDCLCANCKLDYLWTRVISCYRFLVIHFSKSRLLMFSWTHPYYDAIPWTLREILTCA